MTILEHNYSKWFDQFETKMNSLHEWKDLLNYRSISIIDAGRAAFYYHILYLLRMSNQSNNNLFITQRANTIDKTWVKRMKSIIGRIYYKELSKKEMFNLGTERLRQYSYKILPSKNIFQKSDGKRILIVRAFLNTYAYPIIDSLIDDFGINVIFGSWNRKLKKPVSETKAQYFDIIAIYRNKYFKYKNNHKRRVAELLNGLEMEMPDSILSEVSGHPIRINTHSLFNNVCLDVCTYVDIYFDMIRAINPDAVIVFNNSSPPGRTMVKVAQIFNKPCYTVQHGLLVGEVYKPLNDRLLVWGGIPKNFWIERGANPKNITEVGAINSKKWSNMIDYKKSTKEKEKKIPTVLYPGQFFGYEINLKDYLTTIKVILSVAASKPDVNFIIKPHPGEREKYYYELLSSFDIHNVKIVTRGSIYLLLKQCDLLLTLFSTTGIEAMMMGIPVIIIRPSEEIPKAPYFPTALIARNGEELRFHINHLLSSNNFQQEMVEKGKNFARDYIGAMDGKAAYRSAKHIVDTVYQKKI